MLSGGGKVKIKYIVRCSITIVITNGRDSSLRNTEYNVQHIESTVTVKEKQILVCEPCVIKQQ